MYAMSSDPFVRPFACYVGHRAMCTIRFHSIPPLCSHAEWREEREGRGRGGKRDLGEARPISLSIVPNRIAPSSAWCSLAM